MPKITIKQKNLTLDAAIGSNLMTYLQSQNVAVASSCLGDGICGKCKMKILGNLPASNPLEAKILMRNQANEAERLACQVTIEGDLEVETTYW